VQENTLELIEKFRNKGGAWQSQDEANRVLSKLKILLEDDDWWKLKVAHSHYENGDGAVELYDVCKELTEKYKEKF
jgi:hypothetical protein